MDKAPLIGISRLRMGTDGHGVTSLVAFHDCPLRCKYCLNPQSLSTNTKIQWKTADEVMAVLKKDELYFRATGGGVTFGGGEPLLKAEFIKDVLEKGAKEWHVTVETSLNVPQEKLELLLPYINEYVIDVKDMNPSVYAAYTGIGNERVLSNLKFLLSKQKADNIIVRVPFIKGYNDHAAQQYSVEMLRRMGIQRFDLFDYKTEINKD